LGQWDVAPSSDSISLEIHGTEQLAQEIFFGFHRKPRKHFLKSLFQLGFAVGAKAMQGLSARYVQIA
jgi:hypothetical protein